MKGDIGAFKEGFAEFANTLSILINSILLSLVYFMGVGITSMFAKIFKKSFLDTKINKEAKTYWSKLNLDKRPIEEYYRQF